MGLILWLVIGGVVGWLASMVMGTDARQGMLMNIVVGVVGAVIAGWIFGGGASINSVVSVRSMAFSLVGAILLLGLVRLLRRA